MKKILCLVALLCGMSVMAFGQGTKNLSVEIGGVASGFGIRYDARIDGNAGLGYAAVLSYSQDGLFFLDDFDIKCDYYMLPLEVNYLFGEQKHHFEVGAGMLNGLVKAKFMGESNTEWANEFFANIGYRFQPEKGFMFRIGVTPMFGIGDHKLSDKHLGVYIGLGWSF